MIISKTLSALNHKCALIPFITAGVPDLACTEKILTLLDREGADAIEVGLPYSDPLADGPIIHQASSDALNSGTTLDNVLAMLAFVSPRIKTPLVLFTYYNPILSRGIDTFLQEIADAGIAGLIIPDLPLEECDYIIYLCAQLSIELILLVTPASSDSRITQIIHKAPGLIYVVSGTGLTGLRDEFQPDIKKFIRKIQAETNKLLILGFGISTVEHVKKIAGWNVNGIVIGSAFVKRLRSNSLDKYSFEEVRSFCSAVKKVLV